MIAATGRLGCLWGLLIALAIVGVVVVTILAKKLLVLLFIPLLLAGVAVVTSARRHAHLKSMAQIGMELIARDACPCCGGAVRKALTIRYGERLCDSCGATWRDSNCAPRRTG
ncbi:MAG: hypothetical protein IT435_16885 [Phycisphaerales bacterium]|nr:hypothetical protein [Phycisphaerales bacterium]